MRYTGLLLSSLLAASHVCHGKPLPTPDDPPYTEGFPAEAESISTTTVTSTSLAEETTLPGLYPTATDDFPSKTAATTASKDVEHVTVSATETKSAEDHATTQHFVSEGGHPGDEEEHFGASEEHSGGEGEHSGGEEEHAGASEEHSVASEEDKPTETSAPTESEEHEAPPEHEAPSDDAESSDDEDSSDDEAPPKEDAPSDNAHDGSSNDEASSNHESSSDNEDWSQHEAPPANSSAEPHDQDHPCGKFDPWTIHDLTRHCDDSDTVCGWSFIINTNCPSLAPTPCSFTIKSLGPGVPASRSPKHEKGQDELCGPYEVHSSWSGQFGPGQGFTTLSVIDGGNKLVAYPAYRDDLFGKDKTTVPDVEVAVYALG